VVALRALNFLVFAACVGYLAVQVVPTVAKSFRFAQAMQDEVLNGPVGEPPSVIHGRLVEEARRLGLEIPAEAIVVRKDGARLSISATYAARIELAGDFDFDWPLDQRYEGTRRAPTPAR
jgi:hypothetical protein